MVNTSESECPLASGQAVPFSKQGRHRIQSQSNKVTSQSRPAEWFSAINLGPSFPDFPTVTGSIRAALVAWLLQPIMWVTVSGYRWTGLAHAFLMTSSSWGRGLPTL
ncbi:unnamed protein product [Gadus morhua 'NCC']